MVLIPLDVCMVLAGAILIPLAYIMFKTRLEIDRASKRKQWMSTLRVMVYIVYYFVVLVLITSVNVFTNANKDAIAQGITDWTLCSISLVETNCRERYLYRIPFSYSVFENIFVTIAGIVVFFCFGTSDEVIRFWKRFATGDGGILESARTSVTVRSPSTHSLHNSKQLTHSSS